MLVSLRGAVASAPDDAALRLHLVDLLLLAGHRSEAIRHLGVVLEREPTSAHAGQLMLRALSDNADPATSSDPGGEPAPGLSAGFDWDAAETELGDVVPPAFVSDPYAPNDVGAPVDVERPTVRLDDVGGLDAVKARLHTAFLGPMRQPELRRLYGTSLRGGLLLYGPPGCGKSFLARALAGELGASFASLQLHEVLDMWLGSSERNLHDVFQRARRAAPCVLFIDEIDAIGQRRTQLRSSAMRTTVNQLLAELDGVDSNNEGLFVIGATNHPWDVDSALRRPGRFDRLVLVPPPDVAARAAIFRTHLRERPIEAIDVDRAARLTDGLSGADIAFVCESAASRALEDSIRTGNVRRITMGDVQLAIADVRASTGAWFETARNVVQFANQNGDYDELRDHMREHRLL